MAKIWTHESGVFMRTSGSRWKTDLPDLWHELSYPRSGSRSITLFLDSTEPDDAAVEQLDSFWKDRHSFPQKLFNYVYSDLKGELDSRTWWSESDEPVVLTQHAAGEMPRPIASPEELAGHLGLTEIGVMFAHKVSGEPLKVNPFTGEPIAPEDQRAPIARPGGFWVVCCGLNCSWESEHGLGLTWRNGRFIGIGYADGPLVDKNYQPD